MAKRNKKNDTLQNNEVDLSANAVPASTTADNQQPSAIEPPTAMSETDSATTPTVNDTLANDEGLITTCDEMMNASEADILPPAADDTPAIETTVEHTPEDLSNDAESPADGDGEITTEQVLEAILFASDSPLTPSKLVDIIGTGSAREVRKIIQALNKDYARLGRAFRIEEIAGGYQMLTLPEYNTWLRRLRQSRQESKLSPAAVETLAVVAYKQPVIRAQIESIRGVSVGETLSRLRELGLIKIVGRAEDIGRPILYGTTRHFLELFGLSSLEELPAVEELQPPK